MSNEEVIQVIKDFRRNALEFRRNHLNSEDDYYKSLSHKIEAFDYIINKLSKEGENNDNK